MWRLGTDWRGTRRLLKVETIEEKIARQGGNVGRSYWLEIRKNYARNVKLSPTLRTCEIFFIVKCVYWVVACTEWQDMWERRGWLHCGPPGCSHLVLSHNFKHMWSFKSNFNFESFWKKLRSYLLWLCELCLCVCCVTSFPLRLTAALKMSVCVQEEEDRAQSPEPSMRSDQSMGHPLMFSTGPGPPSHTK